MFDIILTFIVFLFKLAFGDSIFGALQSSAHVIPVFGVIITLFWIGILLLLQLKTFQAEASKSRKPPLILLANSIVNIAFSLPMVWAFQAAASFSTLNLIPVVAFALYRLLAFILLRRWGKKIVANDKVIARALRR